MKYQDMVNDGGFPKNESSWEELFASNKRYLQELARQESELAELKAQLAELEQDLQARSESNVSLVNGNNILIKRLAEAEKVIAPIIEGVQDAHNDWPFTDDNVGMWVSFKKLKDAVDWMKGES
jgi:regulator of replication initiation timing